MMHQKALTFQDAEIAAEILQTSDVGKIKALGQLNHVGEGKAALLMRDFRSSCGLLRIMIP